MIKKFFLFLLLFILPSCGNIDLLLLDNNSANKLRGNTSVVFVGQNEERFVQEIISFFGNNKNGEYILFASLSEKKENSLVKKNQVAEKINYELTANYEIFFKDASCKIFNQKIISKFSFVPKSFGYNFGADRSLEKLYLSSINKNIREFVNSVPKETNCLK